MRVSNGLDPCPNCLQMLSADNKKSPLSRKVLRLHALSKSNMVSKCAWSLLKPIEQTFLGGLYTMRSLA